MASAGHSTGGGLDLRTALALLVLGIVLVIFVPMIFYNGIIRTFGLDKNEQVVVVSEKVHQDLTFNYEEADKELDKPQKLEPGACDGLSAAWKCDGKNITRLPAASPQAPAAPP